MGFWSHVKFANTKMTFANLHLRGFFLTGQSTFTRVIAMFKVDACYK